MTSLISPQAAAELLGFNEKTVRRMLNRGDLPGVKVAGRWRLDPQALPDPNRRVRPAPPPKPRRRGQTGSLTALVDSMDAA